MKREPREKEQVAPRKRTSEKESREEDHIK